MFPRPSRFLRLVIVLAILALFFASLYIINSKDVTDYSSNAGSRLSPSDYIDSTRRLYTLHQMNIEENKENLTPIYSKWVQAYSSGTHNVEQRPGTNPTFSKAFVEMNMQTKERKVSLHKFTYIHNPSGLCARNTVRYLVYVHSSATNLKKRQAVRQTWGHPKILSLYNASMVFLLGNVPDRTLQSLVDWEAAQYGDIVQVDFQDSYRNLTHKGVAGLKWAATFCNTSEFLLKTDDDILLDIVSFIDDLQRRILPKRGSATKLVLCNLWTRMKVIRDPRSKWYISKEEFPGEYFPAYCSGSAFLLSAELAPALYLASLDTPFFWVDDYYITGLLVNKLKIEHTRYNQAYLLNSNIAEEKLKNNSRDLTVFHIKKLGLFIKLWPFILQRHKGMNEYIQFLSISRENFNSTISTNDTGGERQVISSNLKPNENILIKTSSHPPSDVGSSNLFVLDGYKSVH
ncbi:unnamed protein product [Lymnaea stagnalis]|uniref:Hexosyltransferase n=1 Tax=Lymnaea stagnalis TaxID=6523 RepID=A0AAV2H5W1_LYMST